jgi:spore germination cell wall hydrolase CwlJ-like protein
MRCLLLTLILVPSVVSIHTSVKGYPTGAGYGRGFVNPPTVAQMIDIKCLATMIYGEARGEKKVGQVAVAYSAVNRAKGTKTLCSVVLAPKQYSIFNDNPELRAAALSSTLPPARKEKLDKKSWDNAITVAEEVVQKKVADPIQGGTHYLAPKAMAAFGYKYPKWSEQYTLVAVIDNHRFYKPHYPKKVKKAKA